MRARGRTAVTAVAVAGALLTGSLAACGPDNAPPESPATATATPTLQPDALLNRSIRVTLDAASKRVKGSAVLGPYREEYDVTFVGHDAKGTKTSSAPGISTTVQFIRAGEYLFIDADEHYWQPYFRLELLTYVIHKWVRVRADNPNHADLVLVQDALVKPVGTVTRTGADTVDGTPVVVLRDEHGNTFFVAAQGEPYLLRFEGSQTTEVGTATVVVTFSGFGAAPANITPPTSSFDPEHDFPAR